MITVPFSSSFNFSFAFAFLTFFTFLNSSEAAISFAAVAPKLLEVVNLESNIIPIVEQYIQSEEERLAKLKKLGTKPRFCNA